MDMARLPWPPDKMNDSKDDEGDFNDEVLKNAGR
eukprot:CAMPEP_0201619432 /NCGR_PEP_ID=MMETSP0492-20130828/41566_1 /ASSEMBLY_ACC=CAM_ASM_000837 /TAXON_ID=420259 /ORGANISM="Thalassiosira gravida, Strain GMp14c1" /LENGTH=33 /DNA_ID= /DNA_START= /DNA_END= /DNA_ORIENTATION=